MTMMGEPQPRRIKPGTRFKDFYTYPKNNFEEHEEQVLGVSQWIEQAAREYALTNPAKTISPPEDTIVNEALWKYEQVRYFCKELNWLVVQLQGYCSPKKYPQMIATEQWIFLCAAHKTPKECFAIDYMRHTLDFVAIQLNDPKKYPTRTTIKEGSIQKLGNICRRIYRLFAHAYYQHKKVYEEFESRTKLCQRFTLFCMKYDMISDEKLFIVPCDGAPEYAKNAAKTEMNTRAQKRAQLEEDRQKEQEKLQAQQQENMSKPEVPTDGGNVVEKNTVEENQHANLRTKEGESEGGEGTGAKNSEEKEGGEKND